MVFRLIKDSSRNPNVPRPESKKPLIPVRTRSSGLPGVLLSLAVLGVVALFLLQTPQARADGVPPTLQVANLDGTSLVLIYSELLDSSSTPATTDYSLDVGSTMDVNPSSVAVRGAEVALTLSTAATSADTVTLTYTKGSNPVKDRAGNDAVPQENWPVKNHTGASNSPPAFSAETVTLTVDENSTSGTNVGSPVTATDADSGDSLIYSFLSGYTLFSVNASTGQITTSASLDHETTDKYETVLFVRDNKRPDGGGESTFDDSIHVTINVNDVDEKPVITTTGPSYESISWAENTPATTIIATYAATDPDTDLTDLVWTLDGADSGEFHLFGSTLRFRDPPISRIPRTPMETASMV